MVVTMRIVQWAVHLIVLMLHLKKPSDWLIHLVSLQMCMKTFFKGLE